MSNFDIFEPGQLFNQPFKCIGVRSERQMRHQSHHRFHQERPDHNHTVIFMVSFNKCLVETKSQLSAQSAQWPQQWQQLLALQYGSEYGQNFGGYPNVRLLVRI